MSSKYNKKTLEDLILNQKLSYNKIGETYDVSGAAIKKAALRLGIKLPRRRKINESETFNKGKLLKHEKRECVVCDKQYIHYSAKRANYCSRKCFNLDRHRNAYQKIIEGCPSIMKATYVPKNFKNDILEEQNGLCNICKCTATHNGKELVFVLDHIDGNAANNKRDNLRLVCPNCDSQLDTYKSKNKNGARKHRYKKI